MKPTLNEKLIAYLTLLSGLSVSAVAVYYSVAGLTAIFAAAVIPIIIMGVALEVGKIVATLWLKQNWKIAPYFVRVYLVIAITVLMAVTSMGIFGFLSKAHMDQSIPTSDVAAQVALIDEKIKTERENIDANRKTLAQLDASVDQVLARSTTEAGAGKSAQLRKTQQKERSQLSADNERSQKAISLYQAEKAPIAANLRKVEAEVGPIKYIASFFYGETNPTILEKAVTWVIILLIVVFDPLAVILLLASQYSFQSFRLREEEREVPELTKEEEQFLSAKFPSVNEALDMYKPITEEDIMGDPGVKEFFENGKEIARRLDAGESIEGLPNVITTSTNTVTNNNVIELTEGIEESAPTVIDGGTFEVAPEEKIMVIEEQPPSGTLTDPRIARMAFEAVFRDMPDYFTPKSTDTETEPEFIREIQQDAQSDVKYYDWSKVPDGQEYVVIDGQKMHVRAAKALYKQLPTAAQGYIQNEEQAERNRWNNITKIVHKE